MPVRFPALCIGPRDVLKQTLLWAALAFFPNLLWEVWQVPLYTLVDEQNTATAAYAVVHCTLGDASIAAVTFALTCMLLGNAYWPARRPWRGIAIGMVLGLAYTVFSEWYNVHQIGAWAYSPSMPLIAGIGLSPLLQWLLIPPVTLILMRVFQLALWPVETRQHSVDTTANREVTKR